MSTARVSQSAVNSVRNLMTYGTVEVSKVRDNVCFDCQNPKQMALRIISYMLYTQNLKPTQVIWDI